MNLERIRQLFTGKSEPPQRFDYRNGLSESEFDSRREIAASLVNFFREMGEPGASGGIIWGDYGLALDTWAKDNPNSDLEGKMVATSTITNDSVSLMKARFLLEILPYFARSRVLEGKTLFDIAKFIDYQPSADERS